jgi:molybdopterin-synthase adenylyltransferase
MMLNQCQVEMDDQSLLRYSRHILLDELGVEAQRRFADATVLVIGAGGLGSAALPYLAASGIGAILIADGDCVDLTNLQRQIIHREQCVGENKAVSAKAALVEINSAIRIEAHPLRLEGETLRQLVARADIVLDCSDNFATRHAINSACVLQKKMLVSGAAIRLDGQVTSFDFRHPNVPCYACLFPEDSATEEERCAIMGVLSPLVGVIGTMQAVETLRLLAGMKGIAAPARGRLQLFDARTFQWREVGYRRDAACRVCGDAARVDEGHRSISIALKPLTR